MRIAAPARCPWLDPAAGVLKVVAFLEEAATAGVELVAFPETFLSGYPFWVKHTDGARFDDPEQKRAYAAYLGPPVSGTERLAGAPPVGGAMGTAAIDYGEIRDLSAER